ncbi:hypothetical protein [Candidatus Anaplasma sp. TIGMIC]|uniref:hypothetical protein n=1 Tax=Candidatus Anaplasma sp. TIGMIC TaxID=3020713 RepID=UPI002330E5D4|nr:hypothetical protein [Candidatus Anaplasma sp. TIGMIC]MDB1135070.1 hypothetical protein [Candidatus Anaplasma sp. TIGMIC]
MRAFSSKLRLKSNICGVDVSKKQHYGGSVHPRIPKSVQVSKKILTGAAPSIQGMASVLADVWICAAVTAARVVSKIGIFALEKISAYDTSSHYGPTGQDVQTMRVPRLGIRRLIAHHATCGALVLCTVAVALVFPLVALAAAAVTLGYVTAFTTAAVCAQAFVALLRIPMIARIVAKEAFSEAKEFLLPQVPAYTKMRQGTGESQNSGCNSVQEDVRTTESGTTVLRCLAYFSAAVYSLALSALVSVTAALISLAMPMLAVSCALVRVVRTLRNRVLYPNATMGYEETFGSCRRGGGVPSFATCAVRLKTPTDTGVMTYSDTGNSDTNSLLSENKHGRHSSEDWIASCDAHKNSSAASNYMSSDIVGDASSSSLSSTVTDNNEVMSSVTQQGRVA